ncbi:MAG: hypothetical protein PHN75_17920, partial [Syntrophales bacterium]|nr:hypothetical protein [Syntrophales bacterium]
VQWTNMRGMGTPYTQGIHAFLQQAGPNASYYFDPSGLHLNSIGAGLMANLIYQQTMVKAFISTYWLIAASFVAMLPLLLLIKAVKPAPVDPSLAALE